MPDYSSGLNDKNKHIAESDAILPEGIASNYPANYITGKNAPAHRTAQKADKNFDMGETPHSEQKTPSNATCGVSEQNAQNAHTNELSQDFDRQNTAFKLNSSSSTPLQTGANSAAFPNPQKVLGLVAAICADEKMKDMFLKLFSPNGCASPQTAMFNAILANMTAQKSAGKQRNPDGKPNDFSAQTPTLPISQQYYANGAQNTLNHNTDGGFCPPNLNSEVNFALAEFEQTTPDYFSGNSVRAGLKDYLVKNCAHLNKSEITDILNMARALETQAIEGFKAELARDNALKGANRQATQRLSTNAGGANRSEPVGGHIFSRQEIRSMSVEEFKKYQNEIFEQYRKNLIK